MTVAAARKQQKEVDMILKKVEDGMEEFAYVWDQAAGSSGVQKEKHGEELKKSMNKLQRLRVTIREWIQTGDFKGNLKDKLDEARKRIEAEMTRFKEFERDLKTKAFSANALARADELDMEEAEKMRYQEWLSTAIQSLNDQRDQFEADLELLSNKKALSSDEKSSLSQLKEWQDRHDWHIRKLEQVLRALDNDTIDMSDIAILRDSVDYYVESHTEPNFMFDEGVYDSFDLQEYEEKTSKPRTPSMDGIKEKDSTGIKEDPKKVKDKDKKKKEDKKKEVGKFGTPQAVVVSSKRGEVVAQAAIGGPDAKAGPDARKTSRSIVDDLAEDEAKVQADQLLGEAEEFICKICQVHVVGCSPKLTNCSHLFCGDCLAQWFAQHPESQSWAQRARSAGPERVVPCPVCKQPLNEKKDLYPVCGATSRSENLLLWRMLSSLKILCINSCQLRKKDGRCDWVGEYGQYQKHAKACQNLPLADCSEPTPTVEVPVVREQRQEPARPVTAIGAPPVERSSPSSAPTPAPRIAPEALAPSLPPSTPLVRETSYGAPIGSAPRPATPAPVTAPVLLTPAPMSPPQLSQQPATTVTNAAPGRPAAVSEEAAKSTPGKQTSSPSKASDTPVGTSAAVTASILRSTCAFDPTGPNMVQVRPGDMVQVLERHTSGWSFCKNLSSSNSSTGWAPSWIVYPPNDDEEKASTQPSQQSTVAPAPKEQAQATTVSPTASPATAQPTVVKPQAVQRPSPQPTETAQPAARSSAEPKASAGASTSASILRATCAFEPTGPNMVQVRPGDMVQVLERHASGWSFCKNLSCPNSPDVAGWAPSWIAGTASEADSKAKVSSR